MCSPSGGAVRRSRTEGATDSNSAFIGPLSGSPLRPAATAAVHLPHFVGEDTLSGSMLDTNRDRTPLAGVSWLAAKQRDGGAGLRGQLTATLPSLVLYPGAPSVPQRQHRPSQAGVHLPQLSLGEDTLRDKVSHKHATEHRGRGSGARYCSMAITYPPGPKYPSTTTRK